MFSNRSIRILLFFFFFPSFFFFFRLGAATSARAARYLTIRVPQKSASFIPVAFVIHRACNYDAAAYFSLVYCGVENSPGCVAGEGRNIDHPIL